MLSVAYITNEFPAAVEPYVWEEILELRRNGITVVPCSVRRTRDVPASLEEITAQTLYLFPVFFPTLLRAAWLGLRHGRTVAGLLGVVLTHRRESPLRRIRSVAHTLLGVYYARCFKESADRAYPRTSRVFCGMDCHDGCAFAGNYLQHDFAWFRFAFTPCIPGCEITKLQILSHHFEFNRQHILANYASVTAEKIRVQRMGVNVLTDHAEAGGPGKLDSRLMMLSVGRLHEVKDHAFLLQACNQLKSRGIDFICLIAGEGPERSNLEKLIRDFGLQHQVTLLGHVSRAKLETYYAMCDMVVLTSKSEGVPLTLMEAMAQGRVVLAPAITGIPELIMDGITGFLYHPGSLDDFIAKIEAVRDARPMLGPIRRRARQHVLEHFDRATNLAEFAELFPALIAGTSNENSLLQQI